MTDKYGRVLPNGNFACIPEPPTDKQIITAPQAENARDAWDNLSHDTQFQIITKLEAENASLRAQIEELEKRFADYRDSANATIKDWETLAKHYRARMEELVVALQVMIGDIVQYAHPEHVAGVILNLTYGGEVQASRLDSDPDMMIDDSEEDGA